MNIRSLNKNFDILKILLHQIKYEFDFIVLTETRQLSDISLFHIKEYNLFYNQGNINQNDGVMLYVKNNIICDLEEIQINFLKIMSVTFTFNNKKIKISPIYRPPATTESDFLEILEQYLDSDNKKNIIHILIGDINIDIKKINDKSTIYLNLMFTNGYRSYINEYTRVQGNSKTCIDHCFIKDENNTFIYNPMILESEVTDHFSTIIQILSSEKQNQTLENNRYKHYVDNKKLKLNISKVDWSDIYIHVI